MKKNCVICGKEGYSYFPFCYKHLQMKNEGKIIKCEDCGYGILSMNLVNVTASLNIQNYQLKGLTLALLVVREHQDMRSVGSVLINTPKKKCSIC